MANKATEKVNQLTNMADLQVKNIMFSEPVVGNIPNSNMTYRRINVSVLNKDGSVGDLIVSTGRLYSYGVSEQKDFNDPNKVNGYSLPLCLADKSGPTAEQKAWLDKFNQIVERCKNYLLENKEELELYDLAPTDFKKFNPIYQKKEKGKIVDGAVPTLYPKLIMSKKQNKIMSMFFNKDGEEVDAMEYLQVRCYATSAIKFESIFLGSGKQALQVKLYETEIEPAEGMMKPLFHSKKGPTRIIKSSTATNMNEQPEDEETQPVSKKGSAKPVDAGSVHNSDAEEDAPVEEEEKKKTPPQKPVRKIVKKVVKK